MESQDTIVALATPAGEGGIGIVRISGPGAESCLRRFFRPSRKTSTFESHYLYHGRLFDLRDDPIDEVMAVLMRAPRSYTCEDVVELHCHGGPVVLRRVIDLMLDAGTRIARPGEFTLRAFLNGRIDLARAEGVIDLIRSRSEEARRLALGQAEGRLSRLIYRFRDRLSDLLAEIETHLDFVDEDIEHTDLARLIRSEKEVRGEMEELLHTFDSARTLRDGLAVLIAGRPNVGKSSLLNALLGEARAIVTDMPGTTRDTIEERLEIEGIPVRIVDTAGIRHTEDPVEAEGVRRARDKIGVSDLVLLVIDASKPLGEDDLLALEACREARVLVVFNKSDLPPVVDPGPFSGYPSVSLSARKGKGLPQLREEMARLVRGERTGDVGETVMISDRRHRSALVRAIEALTRFEEACLQELSPEFLALEIRDALKALGEITGETTPDQLLEKIFSRFCIGK